MKIKLLERFEWKTTRFGRETPWIAGTPVSEIVACYERNNFEIEDIAPGFPNVSLADVLLALALYYYNQKQLDQLWKAEAKDIAALIKKANPNQFTDGD